jgi:hypothetical protein
MHSLYLAAIVAGVIACGAGVQAVRSPSGSENRLLGVAFALWGVVAVLVFAGLGWRVTR